jgi:hypothetical protein
LKCKFDKKKESSNYKFQARKPELSASDMPFFNTATSEIDDYTKLHQLGYCPKTRKKKAKKKTSQLVILWDRWSL